MRRSRIPMPKLPVESGQSCISMTVLVAERRAEGSARIRFRLRANPSFYYS